MCPPLICIVLTSASNPAVLYCATFATFYIGSPPHPATFTLFLINRAPIHQSVIHALLTRSPSVSLTSCYSTCQRRVFTVQVSCINLGWFSDLVWKEVLLQERWQKVSFKRGLVEISFIDIKSLLEMAENGGQKTTIWWWLKSSKMLIFLWKMLINGESYNIFCKIIIKKFFQFLCKFKTFYLQLSLKYNVHMINKSNFELSFIC